jgi:uncharacterized protein YjbI with pentapeptide repeats
MANEEHIQKLQEGVEVWNAWRAQNPTIQPELERADLGGVDLTGANLKNASLSFANLRKARLYKADLAAAYLFRADLTQSNLVTADLTGTHLEHADLTEADLHAARLPGAYLCGAKLVRATLVDANLHRADLLSARLEGANLVTANLTNARLHGANLTGANLLKARLQEAGLANADLTDANLVDVKGLQLDNCRIVHARFSPRASDRWSVLRRTYTGPNLILNLIFVLLFFAPLVVKAAGFAALGEAQQRVVETFNRLGTDHLRVACKEADGAILGRVQNYEVSVPCRSEPMWRLLLGYGGPYGTIMPILTGILIAYQIARYLLTRQVSLMRDAEERSGISPPEDGVLAYPVLYRIHQLLRVIFWIGAATFALRMVEFLFLTDVLLPG